MGTGESSMTRTLICAAALSSSGCAVLSDHRVAAACQVADGATTYYALKHGAVELNPLFDGLSPGFILALKLAMAYAVYKVFDPAEREQTRTDKVAAGAVTMLGCLPAASNYNVIKGLP